MFAIVSSETKLDFCSWSCDDVCGDEDNCCEYGCDAVPGFCTLSLFDLI